jgi:hypothetical protein
MAQWDKLLRGIQAEADAAARVDWNVSVDSSIVRAHQRSAHGQAQRPGGEAYSSRSRAALAAPT